MQKNIELCDETIIHGWQFCRCTQLQCPSSNSEVKVTRWWTDMLSRVWLGYIAMLLRCNEARFVRYFSMHTNILLRKLTLSRNDSLPFRGVFNGLYGNLSANNHVIPRSRLSRQPHKSLPKFWSAMLKNRSAIFNKMPALPSVFSCKYQYLEIWISNTFITHPTS